MWGSWQVLKNRKFAYYKKYIDFYLIFLPIFYSKSIFIIDAKIQSVFVLRDGLVFDANHKTAIPDATFMGSARMVHACVYQDGMENTALLKDVQMNADPRQNQVPVDMENVKEQLVLVLMQMVIGGRVSVMMGGKEKTAA